MAEYNVQNFTYDGPGESLCYGRQDVHNHDRAVQFTVDITEYLVNQGCTNIAAGVFRSHQPEPAHGKEFVWNNDTQRWVKA
jgi:hypothetical protein